MQAKKTLLVTTAAALLFAAASQAVPFSVSQIGPSIQGTGIPNGTLFSQNGACSGNGPASQRFPDFGNAVLQSADDFTVPAGFTWDITAVHAAGTFFNANPNNGPIVSVEVQIWSAAANLPAAQLCAESGANGDTDPNMSLTLAGACAGIMPLAEGQYFVSVMAVMPFAPSGQLAWTPNNSTNGAEFAFQDPSSLTGNPCTTWGAGSTTCGVTTTFPDMCYTLDGSQISVVGPPPVVPTLDEIGLLALFGALAALGMAVIRFRH